MPILAQVNTSLTESGRRVERLRHRSPRFPVAREMLTSATEIRGAMVEIAASIKGVSDDTTVCFFRRADRYGCRRDGALDSGRSQNAEELTGAADSTASAINDGIFHPKRWLRPPRA